MGLYRVGAEAADAGGLVRIPFMLPTLCAGFPNPAEDFLEGALELPRWLVPNPPATFIWRVRGWCMKGAGIHDEDLAVVDRSLSPSSGAVVVAVVNGEVRTLTAYLAEVSTDFDKGAFGAWLFQRFAVMIARAQVQA